MVQDLVLKIVVTVVGTAAFAMLVAVVGSLLAKPSVRRTESGVTILRYGWKFVGTGVLSLMIAVGILTVFLLGLDPTTDGTTFWVGVVVFGALSVAAAGMVIEAQRRLVALDDKGIAVRGWLGVAPPIAWDEVIEVKNKVASSVFVVRTALNEVRVSHHLSGVDWFIEECQRRLAVTVYADEFKKPLNTHLGY